MLHATRQALEPSKQGYDLHRLQSGWKGSLEVRLAFAAATVSPKHAYYMLAIYWDGAKVEY